MSDEKKPHEETWEHVSGAYPFAIFRGHDKIADAWESNAQADLIAAAPEMARLLLALLEAPTTNGWVLGGQDYIKVKEVLKKAGVIAS